MAIVDRALETGGARQQVSPRGGPLRLAAEARRRLGPPPDLAEWPLVSIVVLNRDGAGHLRRLLPGLIERTDYPALELILVDNASSDDSLDYIRTVEAPFPISILANAHNESFADACNQGAELAAGELLLFLNNDAEPFEPGWLRELVACLQGSEAGAVGPTLLQPDVEDGASCGYVVQQRGLWLRDRNGRLAPGYRDRLEDALGEGLGEDVSPIAVVAACLLVRPDALERVGGFTHGYWYGPEDVDLALKLREQGIPPVCSGRSLLIHPPSSTLKTIDAAQRNAWLRGNLRLFMERWGPRVRREFELDRLAGGGLWAEPDGAEPDCSEAGRSKLEALGFCLKAAAPSQAESGSPISPEALSTALRERGYRFLALQGDAVEDLVGLDYDVALHLAGRGRYAPKPCQLNVLLALGRFDSSTAVECSRYDLIASAGQDLVSRLRGEGVPAGKLAVLGGDGAAELTESLVIAVEARAEEVGFCTRIGPEAALSPR